MKYAGEVIVNDHSPGHLRQVFVHFRVIEQVFSIGRLGETGPALIDEMAYGFTVDGMTIVQVRE